MAKAKGNSKATEKKKERLALQKKMDSRVQIVKAANDQPDPLNSLPSFKVRNDNSILYIFSTHFSKHGNNLCVSLECRYFPFLEYT